jgi:hypothetical protein
MAQSKEILEAALQLPQEQCEILVDKIAASLELGDLGEPPTIAPTLEGASSCYA